MRRVLLRALLMVGPLLTGCGTSSTEAPADAPTPPPPTEPVPAPPEVEEPPPEPAAPEDPLWTAADDVDFEDNPLLRERLRSSPHNYLRFVASAFNAAVCEAFEDLGDEMPPVNLHGDAHLEQYAVTDLGRGLTDYDLSTSGPAVIDLIRVGTSLHLTCRDRGFADRERELYSTFLDGYREGLQWTAGDLPPEPPLVTRIREGFTRTQADLLRYADSLMEPLGVAEAAQFREALGGYVRLQRRLHPDLPEGFFEVVGLGRLRMGIGSALDAKYLIRIAGATESPEDDQVLEAKEVRALVGVPCLRGGRQIDPFRVLLGQSRIAYRPFPWLGYARDGSITYWLHGWTPNYVEVDVDTAFEDADTLEAVLRDIGVQLGRGHVNQIADPHGAQLRQAQLQFLDVYRDRLEETRVTLANRIRQGWTRFTARTEEGP